ncbi:hypothetical protein ACLAI7_01090 [Klebsiella pneumoniae]|uniref:hypothetical protein n=1 Tax=Klebsiella pneumoniae TaxID=573 RepID=UPI0039859802
MSGDQEFPIHVFPARAGNAIYEIVQHTHAPLPMVAAEMLGADESPNDFGKNH